METMKLTLGYSPCPNDTFIFYALTHGRLALPGLEVVESLEDVETLNLRAMKAELDLTKVSFHALAYLRENYCLLRSGGAMGRGCGPLVVTKNDTDMKSLRGKVIAVPGRFTTAHLLLMLYGEGYDNISVMPFDSIMGAVQSGEADAGLVIHEGRFTYQARGLHKVIDLGEWWESETGLPIPLGGILAKRSLGSDKVKLVEDAIRDSLRYAYSHREETRSYIKAHAQELDDTVIDSHIELYVNDFSFDMGEEGVGAVEALFGMAEKRGVIPGSGLPLFL
jgi:5,8-dihydroxy-2-naphthoate synthase